MHVPGSDKSDLTEASGRDIDPSAAPESESDWKSTAYAATKVAIDLVKESSDAFPPLKSVMGGLSAILNHCDVHRLSQTLPPMILTATLANSGLPPDDRIIVTAS